MINILYLLLIYINRTGHDLHFNIERIYLLLLLTVILLLLSIPPGIRRLNIICPRRVSRGGLVDEDITGVVVISSRAAELRRRLWFDETQKVQAEAIPTRRRRFFVDFFPVCIVDDDDAVVIVVFVFVFRWVRIRAVEGRRDDILGVELFRRV